ncbi:MAG: hypothetical protein IPJ82_21075 [Lewinellaceae bacterium]|nr:hypothetical protein [Lewinellaceae bacterium]
MGCLDPQNPRRQQAAAGGGALGAQRQGVLKNFVAFYDDNNLPKPETKAGKIAPQNLHGLGEYHMAIVYHADFQAAAQQLAEHRRAYSGLDVALVDVNQLFNEFLPAPKTRPRSAISPACSTSAARANSATCCCLATVRSTRKQRRQ